MNIIKAIKDFKNSLKDGWKPFFIFVLLFQAIYSILAIFGYLIWIIADKIRMHKRYARRRKGEEKSTED